jgi:hypothetical protein
LEIDRGPDRIHQWADLFWAFSRQTLNVRSSMNAAVAGFLGTCIGTFGTLAVTWLTKHYEEKKARRELMVKTAWDYWAIGRSQKPARPGIMP